MDTSPKLTRNLPKTKNLEHAGKIENETFQMMYDAFTEIFNLHRNSKVLRRIVILMQWP